MATATINSVEQIDLAAREVRRKIEERLSKLPKEAMQDLHELCQALSVEEDEGEVREIAQTMREIIFPESITEEVIDEFVCEDEQARQKLDAYRRQVGNEIKKKREVVRMTQTELAEKAGIPQSHVSRLERGVHTPTHMTIEKVAAALGTTPDQLDPGF